MEVVVIDGALPRLFFKELEFVAAQLPALGFFELGSVMDYPLLSRIDFGMAMGFSEGFGCFGIGPQPLL